MSETVSAAEIQAPLIPAGAVSWSGQIGAIRVWFGEGRLQSLGEQAREVGGRRALVVTDPGVRGAGHLVVAEASLKGAGVECLVFDGVEENPTTDHVDAGVKLAAGQGMELIVGLGGGSAMDCAKGINFLLTNGGRMEDYRGFGLARRPMLPSIGVPTTAGSGSEAQSFALIAQQETHLKMACGDPKARFGRVILDPAVLATVPRPVIGATGMDAISHAVESYVSTRGNPESRELAGRAWRRLDAHLENLLDSPRQAEARREMLIGAHLAGAAIERSMLGAAHACANPLTARFRITHGAAVALMLPHVVRFNGQVAEESYRELVGGPSSSAGGDASGRLAQRICQLRAAAGLPERLRDCAVEESQLSELASEAEGQWTATFNPRPINHTGLLELYEAAW
jgi:alcohol dehydrogenase